MHKPPGRRKSIIKSLVGYLRYFPLYIVSATPPSTTHMTRQVLIDIPPLIFSVRKRYRTVTQLTFRDAMKENDFCLAFIQELMDTR
jgi:hypothetical protein